MTALLVMTLVLTGCVFMQVRYWRRQDAATRAGFYLIFGLGALLTSGLIAAGLLPAQAQREALLQTTSDGRLLLLWAAASAGLAALSLLAAHVVYALVAIVVQALMLLGRQVLALRRRRGRREPTMPLAPAVAPQDAPLDTPSDAPQVARSDGKPS